MQLVTIRHKCGGQIDLSPDDHQAVGCLIQFLYLEDYEPSRTAKLSAVVQKVRLSQISRPTPSQERINEDIDDEHEDE